MGSDAFTTMSNRSRRRGIRWGEWHPGQAVDIRIGSTLAHYSEYRQAVAVELHDRLTDTTHYRRGDCRLIGNFSPIWVTWKKKSWQVEELLRKTAQELFLVDIV